MFEDFLIILCKGFGNLVREKIKVGFSFDIFSIKIKDPFKFPINENILALKTLDINNSRRVIQDTLESLFTLSQGLLRESAF